MSDEIDPEKDFKHLRPGHVDLARPCDEFVNFAASAFPGTGVLPQRWKYVSMESFTRRYRHLGPAIWAKTASYHMLILNGHHAFRIWTDSPDTALCDIHSSLAPALEGSFEVMDIPKASQKKTKPFTKRVRITSVNDVSVLLLKTVLVFDLA